MIFDGAGVGVLVLVLILFVWLVRRIWRVKRPALRWLAVVPAGIVTLIMAAVLGLALLGYAKLNAKHDNPPTAIQVTSTPDVIARGEKLAYVCASCHSSPPGQLPLTGQNFGESGPPVGTLYAPNLTPVHLAEWTDGEIARAIREGIHKNGRSLIIMPSAGFRNLSDADLRAILAYLRAQPATGPPSPATHINLLGAAMIGAFPLLSAQPPISAAVSAPPEGATAEYGRYLSNVLGCAECHGHDLKGMSAGGPGPPPGPDLTRLSMTWSEADFIVAIRSGKTPDGRTLGSGMPWKDISTFASDEDLRALYLFLSMLQSH